MEDHKQKLDKEYESLLQAFSKELEKLQMRHQQELERKVCQIVQDLFHCPPFELSDHLYHSRFFLQLKHNLSCEKKLNKHILHCQDQEMKNFLTQQKKDYKVNKERIKQVTKDFVIPDTR